jgi:hypothetical protein
LTFGTTSSTQNTNRKAKQTTSTHNNLTCQEEEKEEKDWERVEPNVIAKCYGTISLESRNQPFADLLVVEE